MTNAISLKKGANISLEKVAPGMTEAALKLVWKKRVTDGQAFDLDTSIFMVDETGKVKGSEGFIFFNQPKSQCGGVIHEGDDLTGGEGEVINIDLSKIPTDIAKLVAVITIHEAAERNQNFGQIESAGAQLVNKVDGKTVVPFDLSEDFSTETAMVMCEIYRNNGEWKFKAVGQGYEGGLEDLCTTYGVQL